MLVMAISEGSGRCIGDGCIGDDHDSGKDISDEFGDNISDEYISDSYISDGWGRLIGDGCIGDDHVSGHDIHDE